MPDVTAVNRGRLAALVARERAAYAANFRRSQAAFAAAGRHLHGGCVLPDPQAFVTQILARLNQEHDEATTSTQT